MNGTLASDASRTSATARGARRTPWVHSRVNVYIARLITVVVLCLIWEWLAYAGYADERFVGRPSAILASFFKLLTTRSLWSHATSTIAATLLAF